MVNVSAGSETRYWGTENWIEFIRQIDKNIEMILISDKKDKEFADSLIKNHISDNLTYVDADNIFEVAEVVRNCDVIVTPDTSIVHLASCFNKPIVAMFHNVEWVIKRYAPLSDVHRVILSKDKNSIADISVEEVLEKLKEIM